MPEAMAPKKMYGSPAPVLGLGVVRDVAHQGVSDGVRQAR